MKKLIHIMLCIALTVGLLAGCGREAIEPGKMPTGTGKAGGTTNQTESTGRPDTTQATNATESTEATQGTEPPQEPKPPEEPEEDLEPLDISVYSEKDLFFRAAFFLGRDPVMYIHHSGNKPDYKDHVLAYLPNAAFRQVAEDRSYAVYDSDTGYRVYLFFDESANKPHRLIGYPVVIKGNLLSHSNFADLKVGDSIDKVESVDSVTALYKKQYLEFMNLNIIAVESYAKDGYPICTIHYLQDGILRINYTMPEEGKLVISEIIYNEDYCLTDKLNRSVSHKIKPIDLPTA